MAIISVITADIIMAMQSSLVILLGMVGGKELIYLDIRRRGGYLYERTGKKKESYCIDSDICRISSF